MFSIARAIGTTRVIRVTSIARITIPTIAQRHIIQICMDCITSVTSVTGFKHNCEVLCVVYVLTVVFAFDVSTSLVVFGYALVLLVLILLLHQARLVLQQLLI
jgi:hypothetical protein